MRADRQTLINGNLDSIDARALLKSSLADQQAFWAAEKVRFEGAVPLVPAGTLQAGVAYPSSADAQPFYLPRYALRRQDGAVATRLSRHSASDDPSVPVGSLTIELERLAPAASIAAASAMPHEISGLRIGYRLPLEAEAAEAPPQGADALVGRWWNLDPDADGVVALAITAPDVERLSLQCKTSEPANEGARSQAEGFYRDGEAMVMFHLPDRFITLHLRVEGSLLRAVQVTDVLDGNTPGDAMVSHAFARGTGPEEVPLIWLGLEPPVTADQATWRSVTPIADDETYLRLFRLMTDAEHMARLEVTCAATVGQRAWRQVFIGRNAEERMLQQHGKQIFLMRKQEAQQIRRTVVEAMAVRSAASLGPQEVFTLARAPADPPIAATVRPMRLRAGESAILARPLVADRPQRVAMLRPVAEGEPVILGRPRLDRIADADVVRPQMLDVMEDELAGARPPSRIVIDDGGIPVLTRRREEAVQTVAPFWFDRAVHPAMFDVPTTDAGPLVLLRHEVRAGDRSATFYQDGLEPRQIYFEPEEFRLARSEAGPYAPTLLFHMAEEVDPDAQDADGIAFSVTLTYRARPFLHPALLRAARERFGADAAIAPVAPAVSKLSIGLHGDPAGAIVREGAAIDFADGISDALTFSEAEYRQLTTALQTVSGVGLEGEVEAMLLDGRTARIPIRISLRETAGSVFDWAVSPGQDGRCTLSLRNRIESPVRIDELPAVALGAAASASPEEVPPAEPIAPRATVSVAYRLTPPGTSLAGFDPAPVTSVEPDFMAILAQTTVVQGYAKDSFDVTVSIDPLFFGAAPVGTPPLTGVRVEFRTREEPVLLTPAQPSVTVTLPMPLLLFVTNSADAQHYSYAVTNLHADGPGAATAFTAGSGNLEVVPAPLQPGGPG